MLPSSPIAFNLFQPQSLTRYHKTIVNFEIYWKLVTIISRIHSAKSVHWSQFWNAAAAAAKSLQSCPTLCNPIDGSPSGSPVLGIVQARTLEWVAISFSNAWKWRVKVKSLSRVRLLSTPWTAAYQAPPSMGFSRREYWSGSQYPSPGDLPNAGMNQGLLHCRKILTVWATRKASRFSLKVYLFGWMGS